MKFEELKVEQLKKELSKLELSTTGNEAELQKRLIDEFQRRDIDIGTYEFEYKEELEVSTSETTSNMDVSAMFAVMMKKMDEMEKNNEKFRVEIKAAIRESFKDNDEKLLADIKAEVQKSSRATNEKLQECFKVNNEKLQESFKVNNEELLVDGNKLVTIEHQELPPQSETLVWARMEGDCEEKCLCVVEPSEIRSDLIASKALVEPCNDKIVPVRVPNLSSYDKIVRPNSGISECASADAAIKCEEKSESSNNMPEFLLACGSAVHDSTSRTPAKVVFRTKLRFRGDLVYSVGPSSADKASEGVFQEQDDLSELYEFVRRQVDMTCDRVKARRDQTANCEGFKEGQLLLLVLCGPQQREDLSPKLQPHWDGPYLVNKKSKDVVCRIQRYKSPRCKMKVVHLERLAAYGKGESVPIRDEQA